MDPIKGGVMSRPTLRHDQLVERIEVYTGPLDSLADGRDLDDDDLQKLLDALKAGWSKAREHERDLQQLRESTIRG